MSKIDLITNKDSILKLHKEVSDPKNNTDWALYGYEGQSNTLKVISSGDGGIEELIDDLNSGKILYAYCSIVDPNTNLHKFIIINWQGEGVPELKKGKYAHHIHDVRFLLKGAHVVIEARCDDDVDEEDITSRIASASGCNYSVHKEKAQAMPDILPVSSVYKRTLANQDINATTKNAFWERQLSEEKERKETDSLNKAKERKNIEQNRKDRELKETEAREVRERKRIELINQQRLHEKSANKPASKEDRQHASEILIKDAMKSEDERKNRANDLRDLRNNEAQNLISQRGSDPKSVFSTRTSQFDDKPSDSPTPKLPGKLSTGIFNRNSSQQDDKPRPQPIELPQNTSQSRTFVKSETTESDNVQQRPTRIAPTPIVQPEPVRIVQPEPVRIVQPEPVPIVQPEPLPIVQPEPVPIVQPEPVPIVQPEPVPVVQPEPVPIVQPEPVPIVQPEPVPIVQPEPVPIVQPEPVPVSQISRAALPPRPPSDDEEEDEDTWGVEQDMSELQVNSEVTSNSQTQEQIGQDDGELKQLSAMVEYDYIAAEENEISFDIGELITNIEQIDEGWWIGTNRNGDTGMFPSNYVVLIQ